MKAVSKKTGMAPQLGRQHRIAVALMTALYLLTPLFQSLAADIQMDVKPGIIQLGESAKLILTIRGVRNPREPRFPDIDGLQIRYSGRSSQTSISNGKVDSSIVLTYNVIPLKSGDFTLGPYTYDTGKDRVQIGPEKLQVLASSQQGKEGAETLQDLVFSRLSVPEKPVYIYQPFSMTISLYYRNLSLGDKVSLLNMPEEGLEISSFELIRTDREVIDNTIYNVRTYRAEARGVTSGDFRFATGLRVPIEVQSNRSRRDPFFGFGGSIFDGPEYRYADITMPETVLRVQSIPAEGRPPEYNGAVGQFSFSVNIKPLKLKEGEPITAELTISGNGNLDTVVSPSWTDSSEFKVYDNRLVNKRGDRKVFEQVLIPRHADIESIPALVFAYFDPSDGTYRKSQQGPFPVEVEPGSNVTQTLTYATEKNARTRILGRDIIYLKTVPDKWREPSPYDVPTRPLFWVLTGAPPLLLLCFYFVQRRQRELAENRAKSRRIQAPKTARKALKEAETALNKQEAEACYDALWSAVADYFAHRLNLPPGEISIQGLDATLRASRLDDSMREQLIDLCRRCEEARFGVHPATLSNEDRELIKTVGRILKQCEKIELSYDN